MGVSFFSCRSVGFLFSSALPAKKGESETEGFFFSPFSRASIFSRAPPRASFLGSSLCSLNSGAMLHVRALRPGRSQGRKSGPDEEETSEATSAGRTTTRDRWEKRTAALLLLRGRDRERRRPPPPPPPLPPRPLHRRYRAQPEKREDISTRCPCWRERERKLEARCCASFCLSSSSLFGDERSPPRKKKKSESIDDDDDDGDGESSTPPRAGGRNYLFPVLKRFLALLLLPDEDGSAAAAAPAGRIGLSRSSEPLSAPHERPRCLSRCPSASAAAANRAAESHRGEQQQRRRRRRLGLCVGSLRFFFLLLFLSRPPRAPGGRLSPRLRSRHEGAGLHRRCERGHRDLALRRGW